MSKESWRLATEGKVHYQSSELFGGGLVTVGGVQINVFRCVALMAHGRCEVHMEICSVPLLLDGSCNMSVRWRRGGERSTSERKFTLKMFLIKLARYMWSHSSRILILICPRGLWDHFHHPVKHPVEHTHTHTRKHNFRQR